MSDQDPVLRHRKPDGIDLAMPRPPTSRSCDAFLRHISRRLVPSLGVSVDFWSESRVDGEYGVDVSVVKLTPLSRTTHKGIAVIRYFEVPIDSAIFWSRDNLPNVRVHDT
jgi:hypothetical protein